MEWYQNKVSGECWNCGHHTLISIVSDDINGEICPNCGEEQDEPDVLIKI